MHKFLHRAPQILRIAGYILAAVLVYELAGAVLHLNPFHGVTVPALPTLTAAGTNAAPANSPGMGHPPGPAGPAVASHAPAVATTNAAATNAGTNEPAPAKPALAAAPSATNSTAAVPTNQAASVTSTNAGTNGPLALTTGTNTTAPAVAIATTGGDSNAPAAVKSKKHKSGHSPGPEMAGFPGGFNPFGGPPGGGAKLPAPLQNRVDQIVNHELLGPVMHPLPMALLGIAGNVAFLRSDHGQTGLVKEGDSLGDLKLLRIGINRVLIEQNGQKKELSIFSGFGGESLLPKDSSNENTHP